MNVPIVLIGHRGAGKTTLGRGLAERLSMEFLDLDEVIARMEGKSAGELVAENEECFRELEVEILEQLVSGSSARVIAAGGGIRSVPPGAFVIWIDRIGWEQTAAENRLRLRPQLSLEQELAWMRDSREPGYARRSHYRLHSGHGDTAADTLEELVTAAGWLQASAGSDGFARSWMVAGSGFDLHRCASDAKLFRMAGVEIRSDVFGEIPECGVPILASLRTADAMFFRKAENAAVFDCDIRFLSQADLDGLPPRPLLLSCHPQDVGQAEFDEMVESADLLRAKHPEWAPYIGFKYAPVVKSWIELRFAHELSRVFLRNSGNLTFIPVGKQWDWVRPFRLFTDNSWNYMIPGSVRAGNNPPPLVYFLPHVIGPRPERYCAVIGDPVDKSIGDIWHRRKSLETDEGKTGYLKIPVTPEELETALYFLLKLNFTGLSVTSPLKRELIHSNFVTGPQGLEAGNTLTCRDGGWSLSDTDGYGLRRVLADLSVQGVEKGSVALYGLGGVTDALLRMLDNEGWHPVTQVHSREGWTEHRAASFQLVINASLPGGTSRVDAPRAKAWLDLDYLGREAQPPGTEIFMNGKQFFEAQAQVQRQEWGLDTPD